MTLWRSSTVIKEHGRIVVKRGKYSVAKSANFTRTDRPLSLVLLPYNYLS